MLTHDGSVWTAGINTFGQLGTDPKSTRMIINFAEVFSDGVKAVAAGSKHSMVLKQDGSVWSAGRNTYGQLGDGSKATSTSMHRVTEDFMQAFGRDAKAIAAGLFHSMVLQRDGTVWATGRNDYGQLGDRSMICKKLFVRVTTGAQAVAVGGFHSMVLKRDGSYWATGGNDYGQLGDGSKISKKIFVRVAQTGEAQTHDLPRDRACIVVP